MRDLVRALRARLAQLFLRGDAEGRMDEEMRFHLEMETRKNVEAGMPPVEARRRALVAFGGIERHREAMRDDRKLPLEDVLRDARLALRSLVRTPKLAIICILTIGVAIGAATAIFSVVDGVLLRPLPYPDPSELVTVRLGVHLDARDDISFSDRGFWYFHARARSFESFGGYAPTQLPLVGGEGDPVLVRSAAMTSGAFEALGVRPLLGRLPTADEDAPGATIKVLIGERLWASRFGGDSAIIGRTIDLGPRPLEVIGVMPASVQFPTPETEAWYPYRLDPASENWQGHHIQVLARLRDGVSLEAARAEVASLIGSLGEAGYTPEWTHQIFTGRAAIHTLADGIVGAARRPLYIVLGTVVFVLLIASGNVASLLLARAEARARETAVRTALGASRGRLMREVLLESLTVAAAGGLLGLAVAETGTRILVALGPTTIPRLDQIGIDGDVLAFTSAVVLGTALLVGLFPAFRVAAGGWAEALREAGRGVTTGRSRHRMRGLLVATQVALTVVLLVGSGLLLRSFLELRGVDPGFEPDNVVTFELRLPGDTPERAASFVDEMSQRLEAIPGVESVSGTTSLPLTAGGMVAETTLEDTPFPPEAPAPSFTLARAAPGYFETMGIPLVRGRVFGRADHEQRLGTAIVSASLADRYWPGGGAVGSRIRQGTRMATIIGVVGDVHDGSLGSPPEQIVYLPMLDAVGGGVRAMSIVARTAPDAPPPMPSIRRELAQMAPHQPISDVRTMRAILNASMGRLTFTMTLLLLAASVSLFLGAVGVYGVLNWMLMQRTAELGLRRALGARSTQLWGLIMRQALTMTALGVAVGLAVAAALRQSLATLVHGVGLLDVPSFLGGPGVLLAVAVAAALIPATRAARIEPAEALRQE